jgi:outer membrane protein TolC
MKNHMLKLSALALAGHLMSAHAITLDEYLDQVRLRNGGVQGSKMSSQAKGLRFNEASLFFKPSFFLTGEYADDQRPTNSPLFQGYQTIRHTMRTGLTQNWETGTKATLSYNIYKTQINGVSSTFLPRSRFYDVSPQLEISQSLLRNFLGSEFKANTDAQVAQVEAQKFTEQYNYKQLLVGAENAYWRLYFAQLSVKVQEESLARAKKLRDWNEGRVKSNLVDDVDLLQAEGNLQSREIEYQDAITELDTANREFNSIREDETPVSMENGTKPDSLDIVNAPTPAKAKIREDVLVFMANQKLAVANSQLGTERNKANIELYGSYSMNGRNLDYGKAYEQAATNTRPYTIVGVRFTTPLDFGSMADYKKAYAQEVKASEMSLKRKSFEVEREWEILNQRLQNFKRRLLLSQKMEKVQEKKLSRERSRYNQGRTTTFQVLQFEQDYANAQILKLRNERELITVHNQLKLFSGVDYEQQ